jgi:hypothetical protein
MTAGAYSLLAVVLYHTGDFNQVHVYSVELPIITAKHIFKNVGVMSHFSEDY